MGKRGGRPRKKGKREANGKPQRSTVEHIRDDAMSVALAYRAQAGVPPDALRDQKAATQLGRLCLAGSVTPAQWQAGEDWLQLVNARHALTLAPRGFRTAGNAALAIDDDAEAERYALVKERFDSATKAAEGRGPMLERMARVRAVSAIVVQDLPNEAMHAALHLALNGLVQFFKTEPRSA